MRALNDWRRRLIQFRTTNKQITDNTKKVNSFQHDANDKQATVNVRAVTTCWHDPADAGIKRRRMYEARVCESHTCSEPNLFDAIQISNKWQTDVCIESTAHTIWPTVCGGQMRMSNRKIAVIGMGILPNAPVKTRFSSQLLRNGTKQIIHFENVKP